MALWTFKSGNQGLLIPSRPRFFREETRRWYVRLENTLVNLTARVYHALADANLNNANFTASGSVAVAASGGEHRIALSDNGAVPPTFTGAELSADLLLPATAASAVWEADLGQRLQRSVLRVFRAFSVVSKANGYGHDITLLELGMRGWEEAVGLVPYVGVGGGALSSDPGELGSGGIVTTFGLECVGHVLNLLGEDVVDTNVLMLYHDLRRALAAVRVAYDGAVNDGSPYDTAIIRFTDKDHGVMWARERGTIRFQVECLVRERGTEIESA